MEGWEERERREAEEERNRMVVLNSTLDVLTV
jgi:hypothetical protein